MESNLASLFDCAEAVQCSGMEPARREPVTLEFNRHTEYRIPTRVYRLRPANRHTPDIYQPFSLLVFSQKPLPADTAGRAPSDFQCIHGFLIPILWIADQVLRINDAFVFIAASESRAPFPRHPDSCLPVPPWGCFASPRSLRRRERQSG